MPVTGLVAAGCALSLTAAIVSLTFRKVWTRPTRARVLATKISLMTFALLYTWLAMDLAFYSFYAQSDALDFTLSSQRWNQKYWKPINSRGYRDREYSSSDLRRKRVIFVVGDSFAAGSGIKSIDKRFSGVLQQKLGSSAVVLTIAKKGWGTSQEFNGIRQIVQDGVIPDLVVLSFCLNDVMDAMQHGAETDARIVRRVPLVLLPIVSGSYSANFAYWRLFRWSHKNRMLEDYWKLLDECYTDPAVWSRYEQELAGFINSVRRICPMIVVVFPNLHDPTQSNEYTTKVSNFFQGQGVPVINLATRLGGRDPESLTVNSFDDHPSELLHAEVGELLYEQLRGLK